MPREIIGCRNEWLCNICIFIHKKKEIVRQKDSHPSPNSQKALCLKWFWDVRDVSNPSLIPHLSLTQLSHGALFVVNMYAITAVWCWYEWYGSVMWVVCERNVRDDVRDDVRDEITRNPLNKGVLIEKSEGCWIWWMQGKNFFASSVDFGDSVAIRCCIYCRCHHERHSGRQ